MAETAYFRGEGGHVWEMDLPLGEQHARAHKEGRLVRVNQDGSAFSESAEESEASSTEPASIPMPSKGGSKADWVAYAVAQGADVAEAESKTRDQLVDAYGATEPQ
ncbi:hypothetical protein ACFYPZ_24570 [Streptomyces sp. NPDC005506]|uniref:hypothetical protein n=1 Tax=Streptomyces sp. NPDC005506 TaxID=3364718 RepID=UPI0036CD4B87